MKDLPASHSFIHCLRGPSPLFAWIESIGGIEWIERVGRIGWVERSDWTEWIDWNGRIELIERAGWIRRIEGTGKEVNWVDCVVSED